MNRFRSIGFLALFLSAATVLAQQTQPRWTGFQFYEENDVFAFKNESDRHYTQGLRMTRTLDPDTNPQWIGDLSNLLCRSCKFSFTPVLHVGVGQSIYTPTNIKLATPQPLDRPWGGWLYVTAILHLTDDNTDPHFQHLYEVDFGVVGQGAGAHRAQATIHKIIDSPDPKGWPNQIRNQPAFNLIFLRNRRVGNNTRDVVWDWGGDVGNVMTYGTAGVVGRLGFNITGFPAGPLSATVFGPKTRENLEAYVFAGADGRGVVQNIFVRGGNSQIEQTPFVADLRAGLSLRLRSVRFTYNYVRRSREFTSPAPFPGNHDFGSFAIAWEPALRVR